MGGFCKKYHGIACGARAVMGANLNSQEASALQGLIAGTGSDAILKTDADGTIVHASQGANLGPLVGRALLDLAAPEGRAALAGVLADTLAGRETGAWLEFPVLTPPGAVRWFALRLGALRRGDGSIYGTLGLLRNIDERRALSDQLFTATYTDSLTRLTNRGAFIAMLDHMLNTGIGGCLAMFSVDFFRAINMQHGATAGDEVLVAFADLLRELLREEDLVSRIGSERFAVLLPRVTPKEAERICQRVVATLGEKQRRITLARGGNLTITASGGIARIAGTLDFTLERAEMALFTAKAKGRNRLEMERPSRRAA